MRSFQAAARSQHLSSCPRVLCGSQGKGAVFVGCRRKPAHGNIWGSRRASSAMPDDALYLPMPKLSPSMVRNRSALLSLCRLPFADETKNWCEGGRARWPETEPKRLNSIFPISTSLNDKQSAWEKRVTCYSNWPIVFPE